MDPADHERTIERLREELQKARDTNAKLVHRPRMKFSPLRPVRRLIWFWLKNLPEATYYLSKYGQESNMEDFFAFMGRSLLMLLVGLSVGLAGSGVLEDWRSGWSFFAMPACVFGFWLTRWVVRVMFYLDDKENHEALRKRLIE